MPFIMLKMQCNDQSMFTLTILEKIKETRLRLSEGSETVSSKIVNYQEVRVNLTNTQRNKLKSAAENNTRTIIRMTNRNFKMKNCHMSISNNTTSN